MMYISGAKFKDYCSNISRDMLDWVLDCFSGTTYDVITHNTKTWISLKRKKIFQKGQRHSTLRWKSFQISGNYFLLNRHFKKNVCEHAKCDSKSSQNARKMCFWRESQYSMLRREQSSSFNTSISVTEARKRRKKCVDLWKVGPKEGAIEQFFDLGLAATAKTKDFYGLYILL